MKALYIKGIAIFIITIILGVFWLRNPQLFPKPPEDIALFIINFFGAETQESIANIELIYVFFVAAIMSTVIVTLIPYKKILTSLSKRRS
ncbi:hypothetical protein OQJ46_01925 [Microbulbifer thermotolerans]|uniref:Uncharacterized protein n=1 Tax=Microbulbifer thermotolerans TaxID=252514 RepID=A0AB35I1M7_MICTH|nr:hypothetical protein [Microbulbifer thermotolerans]MCX2781746.1 hypothetical protein [Microbulbifer thermotolerans]MCX2796361.1 hypothetical protein [Microbulbifer thermotolerans]MCX2803369.1 hypothetical protein [Microbulbifer thermotolerans]MCX2836295.1 hypothetical protein [Microbulbifer thermotolerans]MCX2842120.1 hypothetical protein [Microbulbifer thermotolerans]